MVALRTAFLAAFLAPLVLIAAAAPQDGGGSDWTAIRAHLQTLRDRRLSAPQKIEAMHAMLALGVDGPHQLALHAKKELATRRDKFEGGRERFLAAFGKRAPRVMHDRLDRATATEVATLQATIVRNARDGGLTKERVHSESDPARARLAEILTVVPNDVFDADPKLFAQLELLLDDLDERKIWYEYWSRAEACLRSTATGTSKAERLERPVDPSAQEDELYARIDELARLATPMSARDREVLAQNRALAAEIDPEEARGIELLNLVRIHAGLRAVAIDVKLCNASRGHSRDMYELDFFSHTSPVEGKRDFGQRARLAGTSASAENIAAGQDTGAGAIDAWWYSPGHHRNMLGGHARVGLGRHEHLWTQMFGG